MAEELQDEDLMDYDGEDENTPATPQPHIETLLFCGMFREICAHI